jgi:glycine/D-amino acid oxidase-like deaminating enzyme
VEIVVIGAGIAGLCTGLYLARAGREVLVVDRGEVWGDASGANAGTLSVQVKHPDVWALSLFSLQLWESLDTELRGGLGFQRPGGLRVATTEGQCEQLKSSVSRQRQFGLTVDIFEGEALRHRAPWLGDSVLAASYCPVDAYSSPLVAGPALIDAAKSAGALVCGGTRVEAIRGCGNGYSLSVRGETIECRSLVIAAGAWSSEVARLLNADIPLHVDVNMLSITEPAPPVLDAVVTHIAGVLSLKQYPNGTCIIGGGWQGRGGLVSGTKAIDYENLLHNMRTAVQILPRLAELNLVRSWAGFEGVAPDALPIIGELPGCERAYVAAGARGGYTQGPAQGKLLSELILNEPVSTDLSAFSPARFQA